MPGSPGRSRIRRTRRATFASLGRLGWVLLCLTLALACAGVAVSLAAWWRVSSAPASVSPAGIQVEVLNGCGGAGVAARAAGTLRNLGFDVVRTGNADSFDHAETQVIDRSGRAERARAVAEALGCREQVAEPRPEAFVDVSVVLGKDWLSLPGFAHPEGTRNGKR